MISAIDTNILLDILIPDESHMLGSKTLLETHLAQGQLIISEIVYAELASQFVTADDLSRFLRQTGIRLISSTDKSLYIAGERWVSYARSKNRGLHCPRCGKGMTISCPDCGAAVLARQRVLSDFIIGAHALVHADALLSRDRGVYKTWFSDLQVESLA